MAWIKTRYPGWLAIHWQNKKIENVVIAGGHAMVGVSMAPGTGKLVTEIIERKKTTVDMHAFSIERF